MFKDHRFILNTQFNNSLKKVLQLSKIGILLNYTMSALRCCNHHDKCKLKDFTEPLYCAQIQVKLIKTQVKGDSFAAVDQVACTRNQTFVILRLTCDLLLFRPCRRNEDACTELVIFYRFLLLSETKLLLSLESKSGV